jgi:ABC-type transport system substrate-binding protein
MWSPTTGSRAMRASAGRLDALFVQLNGLPDGPERQAIFDRATKLLVAYAPYRIGVHRVVTDLAYPWVVGYRRPVFWLDWWQYVDIDEAGRQRHGRR